MLQLHNFYFLESSQRMDIKFNIKKRSIPKSLILLCLINHMLCYIFNQIYFQATWRNENLENPWNASQLLCKYIFKKIIISILNMSGTGVMVMSIFWIFVAERSYTKGLGFTLTSYWIKFMNNFEMQLGLPCSRSLTEISCRLKLTLFLCFYVFPIFLVSLPHYTQFYNFFSTTIAS